MRDHPDHWQRLALPGSRSLIEEIETTPDSPPSASVIERLRSRFDPELVACGLKLVQARRAAAGKIDSAATLLADPAGVAQATPSVVARHKAGRVHSTGAIDILDLCCGIGGDAIALASAGIDTVGIDHLPARCVMAAHNARIETRCEDAANADVRGRVVHLDPARRDQHSGRRAHRLDDYQPGPKFIERVMTSASGAVIKVGPGIDPGDLPQCVPFELEFITLDRTLVQAVIWTGLFLGNNSMWRRATILPDGHTIAGNPGSPPPLGNSTTPRTLLVPDPAAERAGLLHVLCASHGLRELWPGLGVLAGDSDPQSPWLNAFEVLAELPWRESKVRRWLRDHGAGVVEVKTRGRAVDPTPLQARLRGDGHESYSVLIYRLGTRVRAYCCRRR